MQVSALSVSGTVMQHLSEQLESSADWGHYERVARDGTLLHPMDRVMDARMSRHRDYRLHQDYADLEAAYMADSVLIAAAAAAVEACTGEVAPCAEAAQAAVAAAATEACTADSAHCAEAVPSAELEEAYSHRGWVRADSDLAAQPPGPVE